jgi:hypothetical protein
MEIDWSTVSHIYIENNIISDKESKSLIQIMEKGISENKTHYNEGRKRHTLRFGHDDIYPEYRIDDLKILDPVMGTLKSIFDKFLSVIKEYYDEDDLRITSFFISKHEIGGQMRPHVDSNYDGTGQNQHLDFTAMVYLNDMGRTGTLSFPVLGKRISPKAGQLVVFDSKDPQNAHVVDEASRDRYALAIWATRKRAQGYQFHLP